MARQIRNPAHPAQRSGPRILLIRLSAVGDVVHALPCATALRRAQPEAFIAWAAEPGPAQLLSRHPDLDAVITVPRGRWRRMGRWRSRGERRVWRRHLRQMGFDVAVDLQGLWKSAHVARASRAPMRLCFGDDQARELSWLGVPRRHRITPPPEAAHVVQRYLALLGPLGVTDLSPTWRFPPPDPEARDWVATWWPGLPGFEDRPWVGLNPGAGWETKRWPVAHFAELAAQIESHLGARALFIWGPGDEPLRDALLRDHQGERFAHAPPNNLLQLRVLLQGLSAFVGGDTGPTHLAAALGVPCVAPHGGSDRIRNGPFGEMHVSLAVSPEEVPCVPCWRTRCHFHDHLACLRRLSVADVLRAVSRQLEDHGAAPPSARLAEVLAPLPAEEGAERVKASAKRLHTGA